MIADWLEEFNSSENQLIITEMAKKYSLSREEYLNLINLMIYYYVITTKPNTLEAITTICNHIKTYRESIEKHQSGSLFKDCLSSFLETEEKNGNLNKAEQFINQGFLFHSFNSSFFSTIHEKGLSSKEKPWNLEEIEQIRQIFWKRDKKNIFGLFKAKEKTSVFFAESLLSASYYGLSSPTFFRKFIENNPKYFNVFLNRDYKKAVESIENLCIGLDPTEKKTVLIFFQKYWNIFASEDFPYIAISTKEKLGISPTIPDKFPNETQTQFLLRRILNGKNEILSQDVARDSLEIFSYQDFSFKPYTNEKHIV